MPMPQKIDYQRTLGDVARMMARLKKPDRLIKMVTRMIDKQIGLTHTSLLVFDEAKNRYTFVDSKGRSKVPLSLIKIDSHHPLIQWFSKKRKQGEDFIYLPDLKQHGAKTQMVPEAEPVLKALNMLKAELAIPNYFRRQLIGILLLGKKLNGRCFTRQDIEFFQVLAQDCSMALKSAEFYQHLVTRNVELQKQIQEVSRLQKKQHDSFYEILRALAQEVHTKDAYTFGHVHQVERLGLITAQELGYDLSGHRKDVLSAGLILHDVGKIGIPDNVLKKPSRLDPDEWEIMKTHAERGAKILSHLSDFKDVAHIVLCHHENYDGTGYPRGLKGEDIPLESRIVAVVDAFHAIVSSRCYSKGRPVEFAFEELERCAGKQFDPHVVAAFVTAMKRNMKKRGVGFFEEDTPAQEPAA